MKKRQNRMPIRRTPDVDILDSIERWGNDIETAVNLALDELKVGRDEVDVEVLEEPSKGFFGIGAKLAKVRVSRKEKAAPVVEEEAPKKKEVRGPLRKEELTEEEKNSYSSLKKESSGRGGRGERGDKGGDRSGKGGKNRNNKKRNSEKSAHAKDAGAADAVNAAENKDLDQAAISTEVQIPEEEVTATIDMSSLTDLDENNQGLAFLRNISKEMGLDINIQGKTDEKDLYFFIDGKDSGTIIGKRGATLDAIQYLTSLVVNKEGSDYIRVVVDAENYRAKREKSLEKLAVRLANKVARTKRSYKLEPMNPYERKVIHATLQKDKRITTRSEGQDPSRRVVIEAK